MLWGKCGTWWCASAPVESWCLSPTDDDDDGDGNYDDGDGGIEFSLSFVTGLWWLHKLC